MRVAVVGGGLAGLSAAYRLSAAHDVTLFERDAEAGGKVRSRSHDGRLFEWGPNGFLSSAQTLLEIVHELGLDEELVEANAAAAKRYIFWNGRLHALPSKPPDALKLTLLSPLQKLRALRELFRKPAEPPVGESVAAFFTRHFGAAVSERIVAPALLGITGGDAAATSLQALFPRVAQIEREHGSVLRGMARGGGVRTRLMSFGAAGFQRFTQALRERLGERVRLNDPVDAIERVGDGWRVRARSGELTCDALVIATPAYDAARLLEPVDPPLAALLQRIAYAPMRVIGVTYRAQDVPVPLDGFGFLAARGQGVRILGALYTSTMFPVQAPPGTAYLRIFLGGALDPQAVALDDAAALRIVCQDLQTVLGISVEPLAVDDVAWPSAIPQYSLDHPALVAAIAERAERLPALHVIGNAYRGIGVGDTVREAVAHVNER
jgi:oxygen-dependent protoporphyrinogen oxidase